MKTTYWDEKDARWVTIVKEGERVRHHKLPRTIKTRSEALEASLPLTTAFAPHLKEKTTYA